MNLSRPLLKPSKLLYRIGLGTRMLLPKRKCHTFAPSSAVHCPKISQIYVINLDRQPNRWIEIKRELSHVLDSSGNSLSKLAVRYSAYDARNFAQSIVQDDEVTPFYSLRDQLFVEPQPRAMPEQLELDRPIPMSRPEIAVARSHIGVWRQIARDNHSYALVVEDDVWFHRGFARQLDRTWQELKSNGSKSQPFDLLYLSYKEVKHGAQKSLLSTNVFRPVRGLWYMSGYVVSREGAQKLLALLPCRGPIDLWINHQFEAIEVRASTRSLIGQRHDSGSNNCYSILPALAKIGVLDYEGASLFQIRPRVTPVFAFGQEGSGLSSLAMALSMLGYSCCSDLESLPKEELERLLAGSNDRVFNAYVNIGSLKAKVRALKKHYPQAKFIITTTHSLASNGCPLDIPDGISDLDVAVLHANSVDKWKILCEFLKCAPPICSFPEIADLSQRRLLNANGKVHPATVGNHFKRDSSPWIIKPRKEWTGIHCALSQNASKPIVDQLSFNDCLERPDTMRWEQRDDTFPGNLALFRSANVEFRAGIGALLSVKQESLGVRDYSAASISSRDQFQFGRFEAILQPSNVPGIVTGFFLHRDSPRQEIDVEIVGKRPNQLLINVFYNPGTEGARFDYGYRGAPSIIQLGFDASQSAHRFAIEWEPCEIRWLVDDRLVHRRVNWDPTPIPQLPMTLHINTWPSRSRELAGGLARRRLPATTVVRAVAVEAGVAGRCC